MVIPCRGSSGAEITEDFIVFGNLIFGFAWVCLILGLASLVALIAYKGVESYLETRIRPGSLDLNAVKAPKLAKTA